jgi:thymidylate kinase
MLIVVEGVSAAGKTTWVSQYAPAVVGETTAPEPAQGSSAGEIGQYWSDRHAERWQRGLELEIAHATACFDCDPLKIHFAWTQSQVGRNTREEWIATVQATRRHLVNRRIGFADRVVFLDPAVEVIRRQKENDATRRRGNFELHISLYEPLRRWYATLEALAPGRVVFNGHQVRERPAATSRPDRYSVELFDAFIAAVDGHAG